MPNRILGLCIAIVVIITQIATIIGGLSCRMLPTEEDNQAIETNQTWRLIVAMPGLFAVMSLLMLVVIETDGPLFYINMGNKVEARKSLLKVYRLEHPTLVDSIYQYIKDSSI